MSETMASAINERAAEEYYKRGLEAENGGLSQKAVDFYERALNEDPDHEQACFHLAVLYDRQADDAKAIDLYERLCAGSPVHLNALMNLAVLYEDNNHYDEAYRCLDTVLRSDPNHERARLFMKDVESARSMFYEEEGDRRPDRRDLVLDVPLSDFELTVRSRNCLKKMNVHTLGDLLRISEQELLAYKNFGETSLIEIKELLAKKGLRLGQAAGGSDGQLAPPPPSPEQEAENEVLNKPVGELALSIRSRNALERLDIKTVGDLASRTEDELLGCKNFGQTSLTEVKTELEKLGVALRTLED